MSDETSIYKVVQAIVEALQHGSTNYATMIKALMIAGMDKEAAEKLLERLLKPIDEEE